MYEAYFGLREKPFSLTPDTDFFYRDSSHQEALNVLRIALEDGEGFMLVSGEVGTGKTLLCHHLLQSLPQHYVSAYLPNPLLTPIELYSAISSDLGLQPTADASLDSLSRDLLHELVRLRDQGRSVVVLIDEAQVMPFRSLEALRLLSNLETQKEKLLQIIFFAQPEFEQRLAEEQLRQLRQRITFSYVLSALPREELAAYLDHRLRVAGYQGNSLFSSTAVRLIHRASRGIPRLVNLLAHKAMLVAYGKGAGKIERSMVVAAVRDTDSVKLAGSTRKSGLLLETALTVLIVMLALVAWGVLR